MQDRKQDYVIIQQRTATLDIFAHVIKEDRLQLD